VSEWWWSAARTEQAAAADDGGAPVAANLKGDFDATSVLLERVE